MNKKALCVLEIAKTKSTLTVQRTFRIMYHTEPPTDKTIREWYMNSSRVAACALRNEQAVRAYCHNNFNGKYWVAYGPKLPGQLEIRITMVRIIEEPLYVLVFVMYVICRM